MSGTSRTLMALLAYGRLSRICRNVLESAPGGSIGPIERIEAYLWDGLTEGDGNVLGGRVSADLEQLDDLMNIVNDDPRRISLFADDALAALSYALRARASDDPQEVAWAMRRAYETFHEFSKSCSLPATPDAIVQDELTPASDDCDDQDQDDDQVQ